MKATIDILDALFYQAKATAADQGSSLKDFFTEAVREQLRKKAAVPNLDKPWMRAFGGLHDLHRETKRLDRVICREFERLDD